AEQAGQRPLPRGPGPRHRKHGGDHRRAGAGARGRECGMTGGTGTVLVINSGSSSIKYKLLEPGSGDVLASGLVERIGEDSGHVEHTRSEEHTSELQSRENLVC